MNFKFYSGSTLTALIFTAFAIQSQAAETLVVRRSDSKETLEQRTRFLTKARKEVLDILWAAYFNPSSSPRAKALYDKMWDYLKDPVLFFPPPGTDFETCAKNPNYSAFIAHRADRTPLITFCARQFDELRRYRTAMLGTIIHETSHALKLDRQVSQDDECGAILISVSALNDAGRSPRQIIEQSGYVYEGRCRVSVLYSL